MTITNHPLPEAAFTELADGGGSPATMRRLGDAQRSKHLMLLHAIAEAAAGPEPGLAAFRVGYEQLARIRDTAPGAAAWLLGLPHLGGWVHDTLIHLDQGTAADFGHFACLVAAARPSGPACPFELDVPVQDGRVRLPGLGSLLVAEREVLGPAAQRRRAGYRWRRVRRRGPSRWSRTTARAGAGVAGWSGTRGHPRGRLCGPADRAAGDR